MRRNIGPAAAGPARPAATALLPDGTGQKPFISLVLMQAGGGLVLQTLSTHIH